MFISKKKHLRALKSEMAYHDSMMQSYQDRVDAEYDRVLNLCRAQLHAWARDGFYELFTTSPTALTGAKLRGMFGEAEKMLSPERLKLRQEEA